MPQPRDPLVFQNSSSSIEAINKAQLLFKKLVGRSRLFIQNQSVVTIGVKMGPKPQSAAMDNTWLWLAPDSTGAKGDGGVLDMALPGFVDESDVWIISGTAGAKFHALEGGV